MMCFDETNTKSRSEKKEDVMTGRRIFYNLSVEGQPVRTVIFGIGFDHQTWLEIISTRAKKKSSEILQECCTGDSTSLCQVC